MSLRRSLLLVIVFLGIARALLYSNSDVRDWSLNDGRVLRAELIDYDPQAGAVFLKIENNEDITLPFDGFSPIDQAWLVEWDEFTLLLEEKLEQLGGTLEHKVTSGSYPTDLYIYRPSSITSGSLAPVMILFHPGGKAARYCLRHAEAAEASGMVLIACSHFRNTNDDFELESTMLERFREIFPQILQQQNVDPEQIFMGGTSGGAWRAYHYSAWVKHPWAGVYANVGWMGGGKYHKLPYPSNMRVIMINGSEDKGANRTVQVVTDILEAKNNKVGLIVFEGGHQVPPVESQLKGFNWLLNKENFIEE